MCSYGYSRVCVCVSLTMCCWAHTCNHKHTQINVSELYQEDCYRKLFQTECMLSSFGTCSTLFAVCARVWASFSVFLLVQSHHFHAFSNLETDTLKNTECVCLSGSGSVLASLPPHFFFPLIHPFFSSPPAICACHLLHFYAHRFSISSSSVSFSSPLTFCHFFFSYSGCDIQKFISLECFLLICFLLSFSGYSSCSFLPTVCHIAAFSTLWVSIMAH